MLVGGFSGPDIPGWVNGNAYKQTSEVPIGVLSIPKEIREQHGLGEYIKPTGNHRPSRHDFLAELQGTRKAILPVHTAQEKALFGTFMESRSCTSKGPNWDLVVKEWNRIADGREKIYYKVRYPCVNSQDNSNVWSSSRNS